MFVFLLSPTVRATVTEVATPREQKHRTALSLSHTELSALLLPTLPCPLAAVFPKFNPRTTAEALSS